MLARQMPDASIAAVLNRSGKPTGRGNGWSRARVCSLRNQKGIPKYCAGERDDRGEATLEEAANTLGISPSTTRRLINIEYCRLSSSAKVRLGSCKARIFPRKPYDTRPTADAPGVRRLTIRSKTL
jgi:hypothetical protein